MNVYPFIEAEKTSGGNVHRACALLKISRSAYYTHRTTGPTARARQDADLTAQVVAIHDQSRGTYPGCTPNCGREVDVIHANA